MFKIGDETEGGGGLEALADEAFGFGEAAPEKGITPDQFSIAWNGSLLVPETGTYEFRVTTPNGARPYFNTDLAAGDDNARADSDAKRQATLIDLWVGSGGTVREGTAQTFLLGGRAETKRPKLITQFEGAFAGFDACKLSGSGTKMRGLGIELRLELAADEIAQLE